MAVSRSGEISRILVENNSTLRGRVVKVLPDGWLRIKQNWGLYSDLLQGYDLRIPDAGINELKVLAFDPVHSELQVSGDPDTLSMGKDFEVGTTEDTSIFALRLLTSSSLQDTVPAAEINYIPARTEGPIHRDSGISHLLITNKGSKDRSVQNNTIFDRDSIFQILKKRNLFDQVIEINELTNNQGIIITALTESEINRILRFVLQIRPHVIVIALMNSRKNPMHEKILLHVIKSAGYGHILTSHQIGS